MVADFTEGDLIFKSACNRKWTKAIYDKDHSLLISQKKNLDPIIAEMLSRRSLDLEEIDNFLEPKLKNLLPDLQTITDMDRAVDIIYNAIKSNKSIAVFGDYDVDGATSSALLKRLFK
jgi:single-stranded-DNA-specific exonuclease